VFQPEIEINRKTSKGYLLPIDKITYEAELVIHLNDKGQIIKTTHGHQLIRAEELEAVLGHSIHK